LVAIGSILPSILHGKICNDVLLQLIDCIELMKNEVKKKMTCDERVSGCTKVTREAMREENPHRNEKTLRACDRAQFESLRMLHIDFVCASSLRKAFATRCALDREVRSRSLPASIMKVEKSFVGA
jgi:hypothetical protein